MDKERTERKWLPDNAGVTLVELLLAVAILGIVSVVCYQGFITGMRTNARAKIQHKGTSLAQNVLESLKAERLDTILHQFSYPAYTDGEGNRVEAFDILPREFFSDSPENSAGVFGSYVDGAGAEGYRRTADGKYGLYLKNIRMENTDFDVLVTLDGSPYRDDIMDGEGNPLHTDRGQLYNSEETALLPAVDPMYDAAAAAEDDYKRDALAAIRLQNGGTLNTSYVSRTITVTVKDYPLLSGETVSQVSVEYRYYFSDTAKWSKTDWVYDNTGRSGDTLRKVFLFYQPFYEGKSDTIIIDNPDDRPLEFYIVKQQDGGSRAQTSARESGYRVRVEVEDGGLSADPSSVRLRTNIGRNIGDGSEADFQGTFFRNGTPLVTSEQKTAALDLNSLTNARAGDKIMDVKVEVFRAGDDTAFATPEEFAARAGDKAAELSGTIRN